MKRAAFERLASRQPSCDLRQFGDVHKPKKKLPSHEINSYEARETLHRAKSKTHVVSAVSIVQDFTD